VDELPHLLEFRVNFNFRFFHRLLREIDRLGQERAAASNSLRVGALLEKDAFAFEELAQMLVKFVLLDRAHCKTCISRNLRRTAPWGNYRLAGCL